MEILNNEQCFVQLWLLLERTRRLLRVQCKRFCISNVLKTWFGGEANDDFIWEVCHQCEQEGLSELPRPKLFPRQHREFIRAIVFAAILINYAKESQQEFDELLIERNRYGAVWVHFAVRPECRSATIGAAGPDTNRHKVSFINA